MTRVRLDGDLWPGAVTGHWCLQQDCLSLNTQVQMTRTQVAQTELSKPFLGSFQCF